MKIDDLPEELSARQRGIRPSRFTMMTDEIARNPSQWNRDKQLLRVPKHSEHRVMYGYKLLKKRLGEGWRVRTVSSQGYIYLVVNYSGKGNDDELVSE